MKRVGVLFIHGMGDIKPDFYKTLQKNIEQHIGPNERRRVAFESVFYSPLLQREQDALSKDYELSKFPLAYRHWRNGLMSSLGDAGSLLNRHNRYAYTSVQKLINEALGRLHAALGHDGEILIVAHSLGAEIISNFFWDAEHHQSIFDRRSSDDPADTRKLARVSGLITMGCNIPLFNAGLPLRKSFTPACPYFEWTNYYSSFDILSFPLSPMGEDYDKLVKDIKINVGPLLTRYTPLCHMSYWNDEFFGKTVGRHVIKHVNR